MDNSTGDSTKKDFVVELQSREESFQKSGSALTAPAVPFRRQSSLYTPSNHKDEETDIEHIFVIFGDPGIVFSTMLNQLGAYVQSMDLSKAPVHITRGMRLAQINQTVVMDMQYHDIREIYSEAVNSKKPMRLKLLDMPSKKDGELDLTVCPDVVEAVAWKRKMEDEHWNKSLKARAVVLVDGLRFQVFIICVIIFDLVMFFMEWNDETPPLWLTICSWSVMAIYLIEISVRMYGYGIKLYFQKKFCVLDFIVVAACLVMEILQEATFISVFKSLRIGKVLLVIRAGARLFSGVGSRIPLAVRYKVRMNKMQFRGEFNLDLCYITKRIISMSVPSEGREQMYRNPIDKVVAFFEKMHKDKYMVYDLCEERTYDYSKFHGRVQPFKFTDHSVPTITKMLNFCKSVEEWMNKDPENVIAVHCKGGKGRTGTMVCAWLLYCYKNCSAQEAIDYFAKMRTNRAAGSQYQGIETCSQVRYVKYFWDFLHIHNANTDIFKSPFGFKIISIKLGPFYHKSLDLFQRFDIEILERSESKKKATTDKIMKTLTEQMNENELPSMNAVSSIAIDFFTEHYERTNEFNSISSESIIKGRKKQSDTQFHLVMQPKKSWELFRGNLRVDFFGTPKKMLRSDKKKRKRLMSFWLCSNLHPLPGATKPLILTKFELDILQKDKNNQKYPKEFQVELNICHSNNFVGSDENGSEKEEERASTEGGLVSTVWKTLPNELSDAHLDPVERESTMTASSRVKL